MVSKPALDQILSDIMQITGAQLSFCAPKHSALHQFIESEETMIVFNDQFIFKIFLETSSPILLAASGTNAKMAGLLVQTELSHINNYASLHITKQDFFRMLLTNIISESEIIFYTKRFHIPNFVPRVCFIIELEHADMELALAMTGAILPYVSDNTLFPITKSQFVLITMAETVSSEQLALSIADTLQSELMAPVRIAYTPSFKSLDLLAKNYNNACTALSIANIFYPDQRVIASDTLGIGQLIYSLSEDICKSFLKEIFGETNPLKNLDYENLQVIHQFFTNNLNITDTAKALFMHRNTLNYRIEKIYQLTSFDLRKFDDAMNFKIAMMVNDCLQYKTQKGCSANIF